MTHLSSTSIAQIVVFVITSTEQGMESLLFDNMFVDVRRMHMSPPNTGAYTNHHLSILLH